MVDRRLSLIVYGRPNCHLCEVARRALEPFLEVYPVDLEERNVEDSASWERDYGEKIPLGLLDGRPVFKFRVDVARLEVAIRARLGGREWR